MDTRSPPVPPAPPGARPAPTAQRRVAWLVIKALVLCVVLMWPWAPFEAAYSRGFAAGSNWLIARLQREAVVDGQVLRNREGRAKDGLLGTTGFALLVSQYPRDPKRDIDIGVINFEHGARPGWEYHISTDSRMTGYMPAALFLALWLAISMGWRRRLWTLAAGLLLVHLFVALRVGLGLTMMFQGQTAHCLFDLQPPYDRALTLAFQIICTAPPTTYIVPLVIWMALCLRPESLGLSLSKRDPRPGDHREAPPARGSKSRPGGKLK